jgi:hypothetical protein
MTNHNSHTKGSTMKKTIAVALATATLSATASTAGAAVWHQRRDSNNINDWATQVTKTAENAFVINWASGDEEYLQPQWYEEGLCATNNSGNYIAEDKCLAQVKTKYKWVRILYRSMAHA